MSWPWLGLNLFMRMWMSKGGYEGGKGRKTEGYGGKKLFGVRDKKIGIGWVAWDGTGQQHSILSLRKAVQPSGVRSGVIKLGEGKKVCT